MKAENFTGAIEVKCGKCGIINVFSFFPLGKAKENEKTPSKDSWRRIPFRGKFVGEKETTNLFNGSLEQSGRLKLNSRCKSYFSPYKK